MSRLFVYLQYLLPHHALSRLVAVLARARFGRTVLMRAFIKRYKVDMSEAHVTRLQDFENFNAFFTRELRAGVRPVSTEEGAIVCPADGCISQLGDIEADRLFQAKGHSYTVTELLGGDTDMAAAFHSGSFATVYLSPRDYHRVHMPITGKLVSMTYVPGRLFSVNQITAANVPRLFARNERVVCLFETAVGPMALVLVGAMIVAGIETVWSGQVCPGPEQKQLFSKDYRTQSPRLEYAVGAEMGRFKLGSTAIVLFPKGAVAWDPAFTANSSVRMGQLLARQTTNRTSRT